MNFASHVAGTAETTNKELGHGDVWREAAFISAGSGSADSYSKAELRVQQGHAFYAFTTRLRGLQPPEMLQWEPLVYYRFSLIVN